MPNLKVQPRSVEINKTVGEGVREEEIENKSMSALLLEKESTQYKIFLVMHLCKAEP